jgi:hypothetical protein
VFSGDISSYKERGVIAVYTSVYASLYKETSALALTGLK